MPFPVVIRGHTYTEADLAPYTYVRTFPAIMQDVADTAADAAASAAAAAESAAEAVAAGGIDGTPGAPGPTSDSIAHESRAAAKAATIPSLGSGGPSYILTAGFASASDGGSAQYKRGLPNQSGGFTSADGEHWELVADRANARQFGAIADGGSHALSTRYGTLAAAQVDYPFATSLTQQIDYCAVKLASNYCFGSDLSLSSYSACQDTYVNLSHFTITGAGWTTNEHAGKTLFVKFPNDYIQTGKIASNTSTVLTLTGDMVGPFGAYNWDHTCTYALASGGENGSQQYLNKELYLPSGLYQFGDDTWTIRNVVGVTITGAGKLATTIRGNKTLLAVDGMWHSYIGRMGFELQAGDASVAVDIDGNVPGHPYDTRGTQGITFQDCYFDGCWSAYAFALNRQGGGGAQGDHCMWINCYFARAVVACLATFGYNTLSNTVVGGNIAQYTKYGIWVSNGSMSLYGPTFQCGPENFLTVVENNGADIRLGEGGVYDPCVVDGVSSESIKLFYNGGAEIAHVRNCRARNDGYTWSASTIFGTGPGAFSTYCTGGGRFWKATTNGTTGTTEPDWASIPNNAASSGGTISDGSVVWTELPVLWIDDPGGQTTVEFATCAANVGHYNVLNPNNFNRGGIKKIDAAGTYWLGHETTTVVVNAHDGNVVLKPNWLTVHQGYRLRVIKVSNAPYTVLVDPPAWGAWDDGGAWGSGRRAVREYYADNQWFDEFAGPISSYRCVMAWDAPSSMPALSLTDGATINTNAGLAEAFRVTLGGNRTLANPTNMADGRTYVWRIKQDGTGSRTLSYGSKFKWPAGTPPTLSTAAGAVDVITAIYWSDSDTLDARCDKAFS